MWLRKKTQKHQTSCTSCIIKPHNHLDRLCVNGIYKRPLRVPTKENAPVLIAVNIGGKNRGVRIDSSQTSWNVKSNGPQEASLRTKLVEVMEFQLNCFKSWKMMLWKWCTQYASTFVKLSSGHRTGKGQFSFLFQRKTMPKNAQTTAQLHSCHTLVK